MGKLKIAVIILADVGTGEAMGRVLNALEAAKEYKEAGDDVRLIFDGAGSKWVPELSKPDHKLHGLYASVRDNIAGVCDYCSGAFGVHGAIESCGVVFLDEYENHISFRRLSAEGYQIITF